MSDGETPSWAGVNPLPITPLVLLPPLLMKTAALLKLPIALGLKLTVTDPVWPGARLYGLPLTIAKGSAILTLPVKVNCPALLS